MVIGPHFIVPAAGVLAGMPCVRCMSRTSRGMMFVFMLAGCSLNTVLVFSSSSDISQAFVGWMIL